MKIKIKETIKIIIKPIIIYNKIINCRNRNNGFISKYIGSCNEQYILYNKLVESLKIRKETFGF